MAGWPVPAPGLTGPLHQVGTGFPVPSGRECEIGDAIGTVHGEIYFLSPWQVDGRRLRAICGNKRLVLCNDIHRLASGVSLVEDVAGLAPRDTETPLLPSCRKHVRS